MVPHPRPRLVSASPNCKSKCWGRAGYTRTEAEFMAMPALGSPTAQSVTPPTLASLTNVTPDYVSPSA